MAPLHALGAGLVAGAVGSLAQTAFFAATKAIAPSPPAGAFAPPEPEQQSESETETVARRVVEGLAKRPIAHKGLGGRLVHLAFGAAWGGLYGLLRGSRRRSTPAIDIPAFSTAVWMASDNVILPAFRLAAPATAYPVKSHAYAVAAHWAYGAAVWAVFEALRPRAWTRARRVALAAGATRRLPRALRWTVMRGLVRARDAF